MQRYQHVLIPLGLALMALATGYLFFHDTGTTRGAFILGVDGLKWLVVRMNGILAVVGVPEPKPVPGFVPPYHPDPFLSLPLDAMALGVITAGSAFLYVDDVQRRWKQRKPAPSPFQEL